MSVSAAHILPATAAHTAPWARMRVALWPDGSLADHHSDIADMLAGGDDLTAFVAIDGHGEAIAFVEAALRRDYVNGCDTSPVVFVEGLYVAPQARRRGVALALIDAVAAWGRARGCTETRKGSND